ncbi:MAG: cyclic nucleotide-binding domain-containing protein [Candidatus Latescibacteria bacterium]|nr:cyclic nucleotide-binding domain-containing protein [Candidatus Latescibacterota bacterium]
MALAGLKKLLRVEVRREEWARLLPLSLAYGLVMASLYVLKPVRNALFLNHLGIHQLPYVLLLVALVGGIAAGIFARFSRSVGIDRLIFGTFLVLMSNLLAFRLILPQEWPWVFYAFYVWVNLYGLIATSLLWLLTNALFDAREARRLFGFVGAGGIAGAILGGLFTGWMVEVVGTENLLFFCVGFLGICLVLVRLARPVQEGSFQERRSPEGVLGSIARSDLLRLVGVTTGLTAVVATVADVQFNDIVNQAFPTKDAKTAFFGEFFAYLSLFAFLFQLLVTSRILRSLGVGAALLFLPLSLAGGSLALLLIPGLWGGIFVKLGDGGFRHSIHKSATEILFLPVPSDIKRRTKVFLDVTVDNLATGLGAILVLLLTGPVGVAYRHLSLLSLGLIAAWVGLIFRVRAAYVDAFRMALRRRSLDVHRETVGVSDVSAIRILLKALESPDEQEVLYALDLLETVRNVHLTPHLVRLLYYPSEAVRRRVLHILVAEGDRSVLPEVKPLLNDASIEVQVEAVNYICMYDKLPPMEQIRRLLNDPQNITRAAAAACLIVHHQDASALSLARQTLEEMLRGDWGDQGKMAATKTLEVIQDASLYSHLVSLLEDRSPAVAIQAIQTAGVIQRPEYIFSLTRKLEDRRFRGYGVRALAQYGADALDGLRTLLADGATSLDLKKGILRVLALIQAQASVELLVGVLGYSDASMRYEALRALNRLRTGDGPLHFHPEAVRAVLGREVRDYYETLSLLHACCPEREEAGRDGCTDLLGCVLRERLGHALERIFRLLGLLYPHRDIRSAYSALTGRQRDLRPGALEFLDNVLSPDDRRRIVPLVDDLSLEERLRRGGARLEEMNRGREGILLSLMHGEDAWLRACAVYTVGQRRIVSLLSRVEAAQADEDPLVREAAVLALRQFHGPVDPGEMLTRMGKAIFLRQVAIFSHTTTQELARIADIAHPEPFPGGATIFAEGSAADAVYLVVSGRVRLYGAGRDLGVVRAGESVGVWEMFEGRPRGETASLLEDTLTLRVGRPDLFDLMDTHPEIARGILKTMVGYIRRQIDAIH